MTLCNAQRKVLGCWGEGERGDKHVYMFLCNSIELAPSFRFWGLLVGFRGTVRLVYILCVIAIA